MKTTGNKRRKQSGALKQKTRDVPGSPVVKTPQVHCKGLGSIPGWGTKMLHDTA